MTRWNYADGDEQVSVRQFSCIHGVEPDNWCEMCDPEESARYLALLHELDRVKRAQRDVEAQLAVHSHGPWQCHECWPGSG